jgi:hypothetical protein
VRAFLIDGGAPMGFYFPQSYIHLANPYPQGSGFRLNYEVDNTGPDDPGHSDHVELWASDGTKVIDRYEQVAATTSGQRYGVFVDVGSLNAGYYDLAITLPDGTASGSTVIVQ